jgi:hypothetical protein
MGSRISGLLANVFLHHLESSIVPNIPVAIYRRYVDDIFFLTKDEITAESIADTFNNYNANLKFELEKSVHGKLNLLDFGVVIYNGIVKFNFYQKSARSNVFVNFNSNQPFSLKKNVVISEWRRILRRCGSEKEISKEKKCFVNKLQYNDYPIKIVKKWLRTAQRNYLTYKSDNVNKIFYLSTPFINDGINKQVKKALTHLGLNIRLVHKSQRLDSWLKQRDSSSNKCSLANCKLKNNFCNRNMVVYKYQCDCGANYIGSTIRPLHMRIKEHHNLTSSSIFEHKLICNGNWRVNIGARGNDLIDLRLKEAIMIDDFCPTLNRKEEVKPFHLVV